MFAQCLASWVLFHQGHVISLDVCVVTGTSKGEHFCLQHSAVSEIKTGSLGYFQLTGGFGLVHRMFS